ncbi:MAG: hypothetical protein AB7R55_23695 [Gemmatimonadales bacterium]
MHFIARPPPSSSPPPRTGSHDLTALRRTLAGLGLWTLVALPRPASGQAPPPWTAKLAVDQPVRVVLITGEARTGSIHGILDGRLAIASDRGIEELRYDLIRTLDRRRGRATLRTGLFTGVGVGILAGLVAYLGYQAGGTDLTRAELAGQVGSYGVLGGLVLGTVIGATRSPWVRIYP